MADIRITIEGARGIGKTTFAKYLFNLLTNSTYYVDKVRDSNPVDTNWIQNLTRTLMPRRRIPRSVEIVVIETGFTDEVIYDEDEA